MTVSVVALGSAGDVHPLLAVATSLAQRGHDVEFLTNPEFEMTVLDAGLLFIPIGTRAQYGQAAANPLLWHPIKGLGVLWRNLYAPAMRPVFEHIRQHPRRDQCVMLASPVAFGARLAHEALGVPLLGAYTAPAILRSCKDPLTVAQYRVPGWVPGAARRGLWQALDHYKLEPMARPGIETLRHELGLPPLPGSIFGQWMYAPKAGVGLFPPWFGPAQPDWPAPVTLSDFPFFDADAGATGHSTLPPDVQRFLDDGPAPVVFMPGSAMQHAQDFFAAAAAACEQLGRRGILLTRTATQVPVSLPPDVRHFGYLPFAALLPRAAALVHHGGIGSCAQALRARIPQLVMPMAHDQFDNAMRLQRLGVCRVVERKEFTGTRVAAELARLLADDAVAAACHSVDARPTNGAADAVEALIHRLTSVSGQQP